MVRRSKNLETGVLIRMQRPRARLGTKPSSPVANRPRASLCRFPFRFSIGRDRTLGFSRRDLTAKCERFPSMDGGSQEGRGFAHLLRRPASRCVTLRYVRVTDLFRIASFRKINKQRKHDMKEARNIRNRVILQENLRTIIGFVSLIDSKLPFDRRGTDERYFYLRGRA